MHRWLNSKSFAWSFMALGLCIQVLTFYWANSQCLILNSQFSILNSQLPWISLLSGCLGICSVCLSAQGNIWTYLFGFAQVVTYTWLCVQQRFYGEIAINAYYFFTMIYGVYSWRRHLQSPDGNEPSLITPRRLPAKVLCLIALATVLCSIGIGLILNFATDDTQPYLDAFTTVPALVAQILMIMVYREHWFIWLAVDVLSVVMWVRAGDWCMAAQYAFWCANCFYGLYKWKKLEQ